jgi:hypothetical protein
MISSGFDIFFLANGNELQSDVGQMARCNSYHNDLKLRGDEPSGDNRNTLSQSRRDRPDSWGFADRGGARSANVVRAQASEANTG